MSVRTSSDINMLPPFLIQFKGKFKLELYCLVKRYTSHVIYQSMTDVDSVNSAFMLFLQLALSICSFCPLMCTLMIKSCIDYPALSYVFDLDADTPIQKKCHIYKVDHLL